MYENSIKVPFIVSHPGVLPQDMVPSAMIASRDLMPTLLEYMNLPPCLTLSYPASHY